MSQTKNREQAARWLKTAEEDFLAAQTLDKQTMPIFETLEALQQDILA